MTGPKAQDAPMLHQLARAGQMEGGSHLARCTSPWTKSAEGVLAWDIADLKSLYLEQLQELCDCHSKMVPALLDMAAAAGSAEVKGAIDQQRKMAVLHRRQLEAILQRHGANPKPDIDKVTSAFVRRAEHIMRSAWFKKCHFQVTPEIDRALMIKGFLVLSVTLI